MHAALYRSPFRRQHEAGFEMPIVPVRSEAQTTRRRHNLPPHRLRGGGRCVVWGWGDVGVSILPARDGVKYRRLGFLGLAAGVMACCAVSPDVVSWYGGTQSYSGLLVDRASVTDGQVVVNLLNVSDEPLDVFGMHVPCGFEAVSRFPRRLASGEAAQFTLRTEVVGQFDCTLEVFTLPTRYREVLPFRVDTRPAAAAPEMLRPTADERFKTTVHPEGIDLRQFGDSLRRRES